MKNSVLNWLLYAALAVMLPGCGVFGTLWGDESKDIQAFDTPAQVLASQAESYYRDGEWDEAAELYQQLKDRYPYSKYALLADLRVGDAYLKAKRYDEAVLAYDDFIRLHPNNDAVPYAIFQMGMVHYEQILGPGRDPSNAQKASETFQRLIRKYPKSKEAIKAQPKLKDALHHAAAHDMYVGEFYYRTSHYNAAIYRFKKVLTNYPDVGLYGEALGFIKKCQERLASMSPEEKKELIDRRDLERPLLIDEAPPDVLEDSTVGPVMGMP